MPVVEMGMVDKEVVVLVRGEDVCLRRTSVTVKTALLVSMVGMMGLADVEAMGVVIVGAAVSIVSGVQELELCQLLLQSFLLHQVHQPGVLVVRAVAGALHGLLNMGCGGDYSHG